MIWWRSVWQTPQHMTFINTSSAPVFLSHTYIFSYVYLYTHVYMSISIFVCKGRYRRVKVYGERTPEGSLAAHPVVFLSSFKLPISDSGVSYTQRFAARYIWGERECMFEMVGTKAYIIYTHTMRGPGVLPILRLKVSSMFLS